MHYHQKTKIIMIAGPTAVGKSALAVHLAKKFNGEIISADSRQVYRGLDLGTGKISKREMQGIRHHLLDVASPHRQFNVREFKERAEKLIEEINHRGKVVILCGGTGFYIDTLLGKKHIPPVEPDEKLRARLERIPAEKLFKILQGLDPGRARNIDQENPRRLIRAIEIARALGVVRSSEPRLTENRPYEILKIALMLPKSKLRQKISARLNKRFRQGMVAEVKRLHMKGLSWKRMEELGLEYRFLARFLQQKMSREEMIRKLETEIWRYAKRQLTWFRRNDEIQWFNLNEQSKIFKLAENFIKKSARQYAERETKGTSQSSETTDHTE